MFHYFIAGENRPNPPLPEALAHLRGLLLSRQKTTGPANAHGLLLSRAERPLYKPADQVWRQIHGTQVWVGMDKADPIKPEQLQRAEAVGGQWVTLADGQGWLVPVAAMSNEQSGYECKLPRKRSIGTNGKWEAGDVVARYADLWRAACLWYDKKHSILSELLGDGHHCEFSLEDESNAAVTALATHYHLGPVECDLLGLFDDQAVMAILDGLCDLISFDMLLGKPAAAEVAHPLAA